jgi:hypothetical protein
VWSSASVVICPTLPLSAGRVHGVAKQSDGGGLSTRRACWIALMY